MPEVEVDGATVEIGDTTILVTGEGGEPLSLDHLGQEDGYVAYQAPGDNVALRFMEEDDGK